MRAHSSHGIRVEDLDLETAVLTPQNGFLTHAFADQLRGQFRDIMAARLADGFLTIVVDLQNVTEVDSSGLALLLGIRRRAEAGSAMFTLRGLTPPVKRMIQLTNSGPALGLDQD